MVIYEWNECFREEAAKKRRRIKEEEEEEEYRRQRSISEIIAVLTDELEVRGMEKTAIQLHQDFEIRIRKINGAKLDGVLLHIESIIQILSSELEVLRLQHIRCR